MSSISILSVLAKLFQIPLSSYGSYLLALYRSALHPPVLFAFSLVNIELPPIFADCAILWIAIGGAVLRTAHTVNRDRIIGSSSFMNRLEKKLAGLNLSSYLRIAAAGKKLQKLAKSSSGIAISRDFRTKSFTVRYAKIFLRFLASASWFFILWPVALMDILKTPRLFRALDGEMLLFGPRMRSSNRSPLIIDLRVVLLVQVLAVVLCTLTSIALNSAALWDYAG